MLFQAILEEEALEDDLKNHKEAFCCKMYETERPMVIYNITPHMTGCYTTSLTVSYCNILLRTGSVARYVE